LLGRFAETAGREYVVVDVERDRLTGMSTSTVGMRGLGDRMRRRSMTRHCDLSHQRATRAVVRIEVKSNWASRPGRPMIRTVFLCASHAHELRELGIEVVE
jgi:hypothetical protein